MARTNNQSPRIAGEPRRRFAFLSRVESHIQGKTLGGLMELVPLLVTVIVITFIIGYTDGFVRSLGLVSGRPWDFPGVGLIACIVVLYLAGLAIATYPGRKGMDLIHVVLNKIPVVKTVYSVTQQATVSGQSRYKLVDLAKHTSPRMGRAEGGVMRKGKGASIMDYFETLEDPRIDRCKRHQLLDIIAIAICAVICGADSWVYIELFGKSKLEWFRTFLELPHGIPSHDTFGDVFSRLDPEQFQQCFMAWTQAVSDLIPGEVVAIDGKTVRRSHDRNSGQRAIHLVSAWASANTLTLGQVKTAEKSNEITAIPQLLQMLELQGCIVTIDAMGCQQEIAQGILDRGAGYVLALKENQGQLYEDVRDLFEGAAEFGFEGVPHDYATTLNKDHGRIERRECWTISDPACLEYLSTGQDWPGLCSVVKVVGRRETPAGTTVQPRYYISSLEAPAERLLGVVRTHWSIENSLHWSLDVTFGEDHCRIRKDHAPQNMATLRQVSHNLLKNETSLKVGIQGKRLQAGWKEDYLLKVLRS